MPEIKSDPNLVAVSVTIYRWLVILYPKPYRDEYGPHMAQLFRDHSLATYRQGGAAGLPPMWAYTLFDLTKTAVEEHTQRGITMTRETFIRLSGWGMIAGTLLMALGFSGVADENTIRSFLYDLLGPPIEAGRYIQLQNVSSAASTLLGVVSLGLITLGVLGLSMRYGEQVGQPGKTFLWLSVASGTVSTLALTTGLFGSEMAWGTFVLTLMAAALFLGLFGIVAVRQKPMPVGNALPLVAGLAPVLALPVLSGLWDVSLLGTMMLMLAAISLALLGYTQATLPAPDSPLPESAARLPA